MYFYVNRAANIWIKNPQFKDKIAENQLVV